MSLKTPRPFQTRPAMVVAPARRAPCAIHVVACLAGSFGYLPAASFGLELGEAVVKSALGQSLLVHIPYRLAAGEELTPACIGLAPAAHADRSLPTYSRVSRIALTATHIELHDEARVLEPLIGLTIDLHCKTAPSFARSYQLFVDPPVRAPTALAGGAQIAAARRTALDTAPLVAESRPVAAPASPAVTPTSDARPADAQPTTPRANVSPRARGQSGGALAQGQTYTVVRGDTLSGIAARVGDRAATIRATADAILAANPEAFTRGNRDLLEAGRSIVIPIMMAAAAAPAPSAAATAPAVVEAGLPSATLAPSAPSSSTSATESLRTDAVATITAPEPTEPAFTVQPDAAPVPVSDDTRSEAVAPAASGPSSMWLTALLVLGAALLLSAPFLFVRRRAKDVPVQAQPEPRVSQSRQLVDPAAGIDVVEGRLGRTQTNTVQALPVATRAAAAASQTSEAVGIAPTTVDLDVGAPLAADEDVDWFGDRTDTAATATAPVGDDTLETAVTTRMPQPEGATTVSVPTLEAKRPVAETQIDDEEHTLTIVELDMLRQDYETEHTLTQESSKALRDAVADLKATQAARAAAGETATLEMPQSRAESDESSSDSTVTQKRNVGR